MCRYDNSVRIVVKKFIIVSRYGIRNGTDSVVIDDESERRSATAMDTAATCKYYVTKLLGISPPKPDCVYDVRSGNVRDREQKSLFRVFYRSNGRRRKHRRRVDAQESYAPSMHADEVGAKIGDRRVTLEEDTVEDIEKKFQGFRNVFEKCKVKKKKPPRLFNVSSGLRFTLVANTMLLDGQKKANEAAAKTGHGTASASGDDVAIAEEGEEDEDDEDTEDDGDDDGGDGNENDANGDEDDERGDNDDDLGDRECEGDYREDDDGGNNSVEEDTAEARKDGIKDHSNTAEGATFESKCPKDVADKVNSWIDNSVKRTDEYSEEESVVVEREVNIHDLSLR